MIVGALLEKEERIKRNSSIFSNLKLITSPKSKQLTYQKLSRESMKATIFILNNQNISIEEKIVSILHKPKEQRNLQEVYFLQQELEKISFFTQMKLRNLEKAFKDVINSITHRFVPKGEFIVKKNEIGSEFFIILSGSCFVLEEDDSSFQKNFENRNEQNFSDFRQAIEWSENTLQESSFEQESPLEESKQIKNQKQITSPKNSIQRTILQNNDRKYSLVHSLFKSSLPNLKIIKILTQGESFGEKAVLSQFQKRTAYIQAKEDCSLLILSKNDYLSIIGNKKTQAAQKVSVFLSQFKFLEGWQSQDLQTLSTYFSIQKFHKGENVLQEGNKGQDVFIIMKGSVKIYKEILFNLPQVENLSESRQRSIKQVAEIAKSQAGEIFGEESVVNIGQDCSRYFSVQVTSIKATIIRANAQILIQRLWDPASKQLFINQAQKKLQWRIGRFQELQKILTKQMEDKEEIDNLPYDLKIQVSINKTLPPKIGDVSNITAKSSQKSLHQRRSQQSDSIKVVERENMSSRAKIKRDLLCSKEDFLKKLPVSWHLRSQELTLKRSICLPSNSAISDTVQKLRPCSSQIESKRQQIFDENIKSGQIQNRHESWSKNKIKTNSSKNLTIQRCATQSAFKQKKQDNKPDFLQSQDRRYSEGNENVIFQSQFDEIVEDLSKKKNQEDLTVSFHSEEAKKIEIPQNSQEENKIEEFRKILRESRLNSPMKKNNNTEIKTYKFKKLIPFNQTGFSLFEQEYSQFSKDEQDRLRAQEQRFDKSIDKSLKMQVSLIEQDMMEALSAKGQQIAKEINVELKSENENYILKLFGNMEKYGGQSSRLQRIKHYSNILRNKLQNKEHHPQKQIGEKPQKSPIQNITISKSLEEDKPPTKKLATLLKQKSQERKEFTNNDNSSGKEKSTLVTRIDEDGINSNESDSILDTAFEENHSDFNFKKPSIKLNLVQMLQNKILNLETKKREDFSCSPMEKTGSLIISSSQSNPSTMRSSKHKISRSQTIITRVQLEELMKENKVIRKLISDLNPHNQFQSSRRIKTTEEAEKQKLFEHQQMIALKTEHYSYKPFDLFNKLLFSPSTPSFQQADTKNRQNSNFRNSISKAATFTSTFNPISKQLVISRNFTPL